MENGLLDERGEVRRGGWFVCIEPCVCVSESVCESVLLSVVCECVLLSVVCARASVCVSVSLRRPGALMHDEKDATDLSSISGVDKLLLRNEERALKESHEYAKWSWYKGSEQQVFLLEIENCWTI